MSACTSAPLAKAAFGAETLTAEPMIVLPAHTVVYADEVGQAHMRVRLRAGDGATIDAIFPILPPGSDGRQNRLQERKDLADLLQVTSGAKDVITSAILVAGPLISSAFSMFLPGPPS